MTTSLNDLGVSNARTAYTEGLRAFADLLDAHPEVELPYSGTKQSPLLIMPHDDQRQALRDIARAMPGTVHKNVRGEYFDLIGNLAGLYVQVITDRDTVCERVVIGSHKVVREIPDPEAVAALPTKTVTETVEDVRWDCKPLLADTTTAAATR